MLFLTALTLACSPRVRRWPTGAGPGGSRPRFLAGMALAAGLAAVLLAYPLWVQFAGPQARAERAVQPGLLLADLRASWRSRRCRVAGAAEAGRLATGPAEYNTFLGWPLLLVAVGAAWSGWRRRPLVDRRRRHRRR